MTFAQIGVLYWTCGIATAGTCYWVNYRGSIEPPDATDYLVGAFILLAWPVVLFFYAITALVDWGG